MCDLCTSVKNNPDYIRLINGMLREDRSRIEFSKQLVSELPSISNLLYTSIKWPVKLLFPMFEARAAYCVPSNYFQVMHLDGERQGVMFSHGSTRSIFFSEDNLILFSKTVNHTKGKEFMASFILASFSKNEYSYKFDGENNENLTISVKAEKKMRNLITDRIETKQISFNFVNQSVKNRIVARDRVLSSTKFSSVYESYGGATKKAASIDLEGYAVTVPHFSPHPFLLQIHSQLGFSSNRDFQEHAMDYFRAHLLK